MRSIFSKVLIWAFGTFLLSLIAFWGISHLLDKRGPREGDPFHRMVMMIEDDACRAYKDGGAKLLETRLKRIDSYLPGKHYLTDEFGKDLVNGEDRHELLVAPRPGEGPPRLADGRVILVAWKRPGFEHFRFISLVSPWFDPPSILPFYAPIVLMIAGMGSMLGLHLVVPLRKLRKVVDRFGTGDLAARADLNRKDEIGQLSAAFNTMAGRMETLLTAERRLLQDVSHELRSPLARLDVAVELASTSDDPWTSLTRIKRDIGRLSVLVDGLLHLTRAEGDSTVVDFEDVNLVDFLQLLVDDCSLEATAKKCALLLETDEDVFVRGDRELLRRAVENVIRNAIRHAPPETPIEIASEVVEESVILKVRDFGTGVPEEALHAIFKPFYRVEGHRSRASGGVGLGLAIAQRSMALHDGQITARNAEPGLEVTIIIPVHPGAS